MKHRTCATALLLAGGMAAHAQGTDITASVLEAYNPGGYVFIQDQTLTDTQPNPKQSAELLYPQTRGWNMSGHSTQITPAFASALAESDGNGGVGVSSWLAGAGVPSNPQATDQLAAQAIWRGSFNYLGSEPASAKLHIQVPTMNVGLIGVAPNRDGISKTETAQATLSLASIVTHGDGTVTAGRGIDLQMHVEEYQIPLGPGVYENYADLTLDGNWDLFPPQLSFNQSATKPEWSVAPFGGDVTLATLKTGDTVSWVYTLLASGTTLGAEHGYFGFVGDPFGLEVVGGNLGIGTSPVPEPRVWALMALGLAGIVWRRRRAR